MVPPNSPLQLYADLLSEILLEDPCKLERAKSLRRDVETVRSRASSEGFGFLTKALPSLGKALDQALETGTLIVPRGFPLYKHEKRPAFMQAYFRYLFDLDGSLRREQPDAGAVIAHLRQALFLCYKLELPYTSAQEEAVIERFIANEEDLRELEVGNDITMVAADIVDKVLQGFTPKDILPRHGPGAVATGERLEDKWVFKRHYASIHAFYPYYEYFVVGAARELGDRLRWYRSLTRLYEGCAKVVLVPKDSRGPRLISSEPLEYQWVQQGLGRKLMQHLEGSYPTRGHVNFTNQEVNRKLALESSRTQEWATLDLKDASDRVSLDLVRHLFAKREDVLRALLATRTTTTKLPDGRLLRLKKFAPMGSALCFPVEALCFWALIVADLVHNGGLPLSDAARRVYVFGDDIIVPTVHATRAMQVLEEVGLSVNRNKSCFRGKFRESCGMDAYDGVCVTPTRCKTLWSGRPSDAKAYASYLETALQLRSKGYVSAADFLLVELSRVYGVIPYTTTGVAMHGIPASSVAQALLLNARMGLRQRWNVAKSVWEVWTRRVTNAKRPTTLADWPRLLRDLVTTVGDESDNVVLPYSTKLKYGWSPVHY